MHHERFQLGTEDQRAVRQQRVVQRLDPEPVARHEQRLSIAIVEREREHAAEAVDAALAPGFPRVNDDLRVTSSVEDVSERLQFGDQRLVVIDLAVVDDDDRAVLVVKRLLSRGDVDDGEAPMTETDAGLDVHALAVGSPVRLRVVHALQQRTIDVPPNSSVEKAGDAAHTRQALIWIRPWANLSRPERESRG
jgi:hypothetical protein